MSKYDLAANSGLTGPTQAVLWALCYNQQASISELARLSGFSRRSVSNGLKKLQQARLIEINHKQGRKDSYQLIGVKLWVEPD